MLCVNLENGVRNGYFIRNGGTDMEFTEMDEVRVRSYGGAIGTIEKVIFEMVDGEETDKVYCYEMKINEEHGIIVYPDEIDDRIEGKKMRDIDSAVELLKPLFTGLAEGRNETVNIYANAYNGEDYVTVTIDKAKYEINVTAENVRSIVQSVVNRVASKL